MLFVGIKRIRGIEDAVEKLERDFHRLQMDWDDVLVKLRERNARMAATVKRLDVAASTAEEPDTSAVLSSAVQANPTLTGRRATLQSQILARRAQMGAKQ